jgi:sugar phosphate isomerase/epimerase
MRMPGPEGRHLTYCTNIHPGERWAEVRENLARYVLPVRQRVAPGEPFGLGLRLSGRATRELAGAEDQIQDLVTFLDEHGMYIFTINGFPHGAFHGQPVKELVYRPDRLEEARLGYTNQLADLLGILLPHGVEGTISTVPGAFAPRVGGTGDEARMAARIARHVSHLLRMREATGRKIALALEPEPCCHLETIDQTVEFFQQQVFGPPGVDSLAREAGLTRSAAEDALREHVGLCLDTCHAAVEFENPAAALSSIRAAGIRLLKAQVSAALRVQLSAAACG